MSLSKQQKLALTAAKVLLAVGILGYLLVRIQDESGFARLASEPKHWPSLLLGQGMVLVAFSLSFIRWFLLVRGVDLEFHLRDAFRLGSLGFMLNQISPGSVGGDLLKAVFIAREQPGYRTEAVATVVIDRVVGLYAMLVVASLGLLFAGQTISDHSLVRSMQTAVWSMAGCGTAGLALILSPWASSSTLRGGVDRIPLIGHTLTRLVDAANIYRSRRKYVYASLGLALTTHCLLVSAFWYIGRGLPVAGPTFAENASIVPMGLVAGAIPFTPGGLGALEGSMEFLYTAIGAGKGDGTVVALTYRAQTYIVAAIGACYYFSARRKVDLLIHEAEALGEEIG